MIEAEQGGNQVPPPEFWSRLEDAITGDRAGYD
jgi:hypothetical protein